MRYIIEIGMSLIQSNYIYFDKNVSSWNIIDYLESDLSKSFKSKSVAILKALSS